MRVSLLTDYDFKTVEEYLKKYVDFGPRMREMLRLNQVTSNEHKPRVKQRRPRKQSFSSVRPVTHDVSVPSVRLTRAPLPPAKSVASDFKDQLSQLHSSSVPQPNAASDDQAQDKLPKLTLLHSPRNDSTPVYCLKPASISPPPTSPCKSPVIVHSNLHAGGASTSNFIEEVKDLMQEAAAIDDLADSNNKPSTSSFISTSNKQFATLTTDSSVVQGVRDCLTDCLKAVSSSSGLHLTSNKSSESLASTSTTFVTSPVITVAPIISNQQLSMNKMQKLITFPQPGGKAVTYKFRVPGQNAVKIAPRPLVPSPSQLRPYSRPPINTVYKLAGNKQMKSPPPPVVRVISLPKTSPMQLSPNAASRLIKVVTVNAKSPTNVVTHTGKMGKFQHKLANRGLLNQSPRNGVTVKGRISHDNNRILFYPDSNEMQKLRQISIQSPLTGRLVNTSEVVDLTSDDSVSPTKSNPAPPPIVLNPPKPTTVLNPSQLPTVSRPPQSPTILTCTEPMPLSDEDQVVEPRPFVTPTSSMFCNPPPDKTTSSFMSTTIGSLSFNKVTIVLITHTSKLK